MASSKSNYIVYVSVSGRDCGIWDSWSGGDGGAEDQRYKRGGGVEESYGGKKTREPITVGRVFEDDRDGPLFDFLDNQRGIRNAATFRKQSVDDEENPVGRPTIRRGTLIKVTEPEADSNDASLRMYSLEMSPVA